MTPLPVRESLPTSVNGLPQLPEEYQAVLREGLEMIPEHGISPAGLEAVGDHVRLLLSWNSAINLSGIRAPEMIAREHVLDSLAAVPLLRSAGIDEFLDIGSGGGFPGLTLALALPAKRALLVESVGKKARFLATAADACGAGSGIKVAATRAETLAGDPHHRGHWQAVVSRAVAELPELAELALPLLQVGGLLIAWKRWPMDDQMARTETALHQLKGRVGSVEPVGVPGLEDHVLIVIEKTDETPRDWPRDPATRRRQPW